MRRRYFFTASEIKFFNGEGGKYTERQREIYCRQRNSILLRKKRCGLKGFTLIELLVVISIIALLLAILIPTIQRVKRDSKAAMCKVNLRQWGLVWQMYLEQNNSKFPSDAFYDPNTSSFVTLDWRITLEDFYSREREILLCPMTTRTRFEGAPVKYAITLDTIWGNHTSYGINAWIHNRHLPLISKTKRWNTFDVPNAYRIPVMGDSSWWAFSYPEPDEEPPLYDGDGPNKPNDKMCIFCIDRHSGGMNMLFMDWSVRKVGLKELWTLKWHRKFDTAGPWTKAGGVEPEDWPQWMRKFTDY